LLCYTQVNINNPLQNLKYIH